MTLRALVLVGLVACSKAESPPSPRASAGARATVATRTYAPDRPLPEGAIRSLGGTRFRIADRISAFAVSRDGQYIALGGNDSRVVVWRTATGEQVFEYRSERSFFDRISAVTFGKDAFVFATGDDPIRVVSMRTWTVEAELDTCKKKWVVDLAASPDGERIAVACERIGEVRLQPLDGGAVTKVYDVKRPELFAWSSDGAWLATTSIDDGSLIVIDVAKAKVSRRRWMRSSLSRPDAIAFAPRGSVLAYSDEQSFTKEKVRLWDVATDREIAAFDASLAATAIAFSPDGTTIAFGQASGVHTLGVGNVATGMRRAILRPHQTVKGVAFAGTDLWIATDQAVRAWDIVDDIEVAGPAGHRGAVLSLAYSPDGQSLASGSDDGSARVWDLASGTSRELYVISDEYGVISIRAMSDWMSWPTGAPVIAVAWSRDSARLYTATGGTGQGVMRRWNAATGTLELAYPLQDLHVHAFALAPDESVTYSVGAVHDGEDTMRIMRLSNGQIDRRLPSAYEETLALSPDGTLLAREEDDGIAILDAKTGASRARGLPGGVLAFSPDSTRIAIASSGGFDIYRIGQSEPERDAYTGEGRIASIAFTPDGRVVAGHSSGDVVVVRPGSEAEDARVVRDRAHRGAVNAVAVAPDGKSFASGGADGQILIWPL